ncbi:hypothetical protein NLO413_0949 [Candidatus Neoehrlichia lotoris str. RAC413]|uniref:Uncharacterized protein n=1 Tax=Candidatus Neoehrlichia procyonis str. RAC413 TaxID=1359163 RepID=A0A0F3NP93_9RICK|nr:hypothetical protein NLO413_0949 [Candidatus Neoehrlichia lotoris str. RAC413]
MVTVKSSGYQPIKDTLYLSRWLVCFVYRLYKTLKYKVFNLQGSNFVCSKMYRYIIGDLLKLQIRAMLYISKNFIKRVAHFLFKKLPSKKYKIALSTRFFYSKNSWPVYKTIRSVALYLLVNLQNFVTHNIKLHNLLYCEYKTIMNASC